MKRTAIGVFLKYPSPGLVKTRLARDVGEERAAAIYREMVGIVLGELASLATDRFPLELFYDPARDRAEYLDWLGSAMPASAALTPQTGDDLGERLENAFSHMLDRGESALVIGTDCIDVRRPTLEHAGDLLSSESTDVVIGPASDGGYYLIGLRRRQPSLFRRISWSTDAVLDETLRHVEEARLSVSLLGELEDIDTLADLHRSRLASLI